MKVFVKFGMIFLLISTAIIYFNYTSEADACCGKCTGSDYCSACSNCSRCKHCNGGGSCGVCRSSDPAPAPKAKAKIIPKATVVNESYKSTGSMPSESKKHSSTVYIVKTKTLNIRNSPSIDAAILYTLKAGDQLTVLKFENLKWAKVKVGNVIGYAYRQYLSK